MYAKLFTSIYQGTLRGNSHGLLVFTNLLAHADQLGRVDVHPRAIAEEVGLTVEQVRAALDMLEAPDDESRSPECQGRRIVRLDEHRAWGWTVVNYLKYRAIRNEEDRREQNRESQRRYREKHKPASADVSQDKPQSSPSDTDKPIQKQKQIQKQEDTVSGAAQSATPPPTYRGDENEGAIHVRAIVMLSAEWELPESWGKDAEALGWKPSAIVKEAERFRQYWVSGKGSGKRRSVKGWRQSWSNWLLKAERISA